MDILSWIAWLVTKAIAFAWAIVWFLLGGWVATLAQILVVVGIVFAMKYGWRRTPVEMMARGRTLARFVWRWARPDASDGAAERYVPRPAARDVRSTRVRHPGDISVSTLLTVAMLLGMLLAGAL